MNYKCIFYLINLYSILIIYNIIVVYYDLGFVNLGLLYIFEGR